MSRGRPPGTGMPAEAIDAAARWRRQNTRAIIASGRRRCPRCDQTAAISEFARRRSQAPAGPDDLYGYCRSCRYEMQREYRQRKKAMIECAACHVRKDPVEFDDPRSLGPPFAECLRCRFHTTASQSGEPDVEAIRAALSYRAVPPGILSRRLEAFLTRRSAWPLSGTLGHQTGT